MNHPMVTPQQIVSAVAIAPPKTAVMHEWFESYAGSERVVEQLLLMYPQSQLYSVVDFLPEEQRHFLHGHKPQVSFLQKFPFAKKHFRKMLALMPLAVEQFDFSGLDVIFTTNHAASKGILTRSDQLHISYVCTPIRYAWDLQHEYLRDGGLDRGIKGWIAKLMLHYLRLWDRAAADRVDVYVALSRFIAGRIAKTYRRPAHVVYPPVAVQKFPLSTERDDYYITAGRLVPYKRVDILVEAFRSLPNRKLVVIGDGPEMGRIRKAASPNVEFLGYVPHGELSAKVGRARAFLFAAEEDFGIAPVEAQACGTPVIAYGRGGAAETTLDGETGVFFLEQTAAAVIDAVRRFELQESAFEPERIRAHAECFSEEEFRRAMGRVVDREWQAFAARGRVHDPRAELEIERYAADEALPRRPR